MRTILLLIGLTLSVKVHAIGYTWHSFSGHPMSGVFSVSSDAYALGANYGPPGSFPSQFPNTTFDFSSYGSLTIPTDAGTMYGSADPLRTPGFTLSPDRSFLSFNGSMLVTRTLFSTPPFYGVLFDTEQSGLMHWSLSFTVFIGVLESQPIYESFFYEGSGMFLRNDVDPEQAKGSVLPDTGGTLALCCIALLGLFHVERGAHVTWVASPCRLRRRR